MVAQRKEVFDKIAKRYELNNEQVEKPVTYHRYFKETVNDRYLSAPIIASEQVKLESSKSSKMATIAANVFENIPAIGQALSTVTNLTNSAIDSTKDAQKRSESQTLLKTAPGHDSQDIAAFARETAGEFTQERIKIIDSLNADEIERLAKTDANAALDLLSQKGGQIYDENVSKNLAKEITEQGSQQHSSHHEHKDLGKFTHKLIAHEHAEPSKDHDH